MNDGALSHPPLDHWFWLPPAFLTGACIGSFLNVVIHRMPRGIPVHTPKRSFCPECGKTIPARRNLPVISWLLLRGKCGDCGARIPSRYLWVELLTALLFAALWLVFPPQAAVPLWIIAALLVAITFIDAEHLIIPTSLTWAGTITGLAACALWPQLPVMAGTAGTWTDGLKHGVIGWAAGFAGLWCVVQLGKLAFGRKSLSFDPPAHWCLREPECDDQPLCFVINGEAIPWWDMFSRKSDRLLIDSTEIRVDGRSTGGGTMTIRELEIELPDGTVRQLAGLKSLDGMARSVVIPREAMGAGDIHLMGMIGAFCGFSGVLFSLFAASILAVIAAVIGRIGFGRQLPFGPFLAMGAGTWLFGGWKLWTWYLDLLGPVWMP